MTTIRIGNDIHVRWSVFSRNGTPYVLTGDIIRLWLQSGPFKKRLEEFSVVGNTIIFMIDAMDIHWLGVYKMILSLTDSESQTENSAFDFTEVFQIVSKTYADSTDSVLGGNVVVTPSSIINNVVENYVTNAADEEDLTSEDGLLKLKGRTASDAMMGHKILRMTASFEDQVIEENTIYDIRYAFDLDGDTVTLPSGCVLNFDGGNLSNGSLVLDDTEIRGLPRCLSGISLSGTCSNTIFEVDWFDIDKTGTEKCTTAIQSAFSVGCPEVRFGSGRYAFSSVDVGHSCVVRGSGRSTILVGQVVEEGKCSGDTLLFFKDTDSAEVRDLQITCVDTMDMTIDRTIPPLPLLRFDTMHCVKVDNVFFNECHRHAIAGPRPYVSADDWEYNDYAALILCDDIDDTYVTNSEIFDSFGAERIYVVHTEKSNINAFIRGNYFHDVDETPYGYSNVTIVDAQKAVFEGNVLENWHMDQSAFNLLAKEVVIDGNTCTGCRNTLTVFDCSEYTSVYNDTVICTNNVVECQDGIMLMAMVTKNLVVKNNTHKGFGLVCLSGGVTNTDPVSVIIEDNYADCTYYTTAYQVTKGYHYYKSAIRVIGYNLLNLNVDIKGNTMIYKDDSDVNPHDDYQRKLAPIKVGLTYGRVNIKDNIIEGEFPTAIGSSAYLTPIIIVTYPAASGDLSGNKVGDIVVTGNEITEMSAGSAGNLSSAQIYNHVDDTTVFRVVDVPHVVFANRRNRGGWVNIDNLLLNNVAIKYLKSDFVLFRGTPAVYEIEGYVNQAWTPAYIRTHNFARIYNHTWFANASTCLPNKDSVSDLGGAIGIGDVLTVGIKNYQCLQAVANLTSGIVSFLSSDNTDVGDIVDGESNGIWRRCVGAKNNVVEHGIPIVGDSSSRPDLNSTYHKGFQYLDTTLGKPIWWNGSGWVDATGASV